jgi:hypothetical protein
MPLPAHRSGRSGLQCSLSIGKLLLFTQAQDPNRDSRIIHLGKITCRTFTEFTRQEQNIIMTWLHGYYLPEHDPVIEIEKLWSDRAKLTERRHWADATTVVHMAGGQLLKLRAQP